MSSKSARLVTRKVYNGVDEESEATRLIELNGCLVVLASVFPNILPEVFREMLQTFDGASQMQIVTEQLTKHPDGWVRGRWRANLPNAHTQSDGNGVLVAPQDQFREASYKMASRAALCSEFKFLSRSTIEAVLAEENHYYTPARLTLQRLAAKGWRNTIHSFLTKWRRLGAVASTTHYMLLWTKAEQEGSRLVPRLRETGNAELDWELRSNVLLPLIEVRKKKQEMEDWDCAIALNEAEAKLAEALYECECCFGATTFEQMASCTTRGHVLCFQCISQSVNQALFGQSWSRSIVQASGRLKCIAPSSPGLCDGCIPQNITHRAVLQSRGGQEALAQLESRLSNECLLQSGLPLVHCPFCTYAEIDEIYLPPRTLRYSINTKHVKSTLLVLMLTVNFAPLILIYAVLCRFAVFGQMPALSDAWSASLKKLSRYRHLSRRFQCRSHQCGVQSCMECLKKWYDPHVCYESATLSLRTTVEAARTAALKRTCPRCGLGFIKDSGCNKMVCICGYIMCYICRQDLGKPSAGETYRHFCQHFRPAGAGLCRECNKCDLYKNEDEDGLVMEAGALAERNWREKEGMAGILGIGVEYDEVTTVGWWGLELTLQGIMDEWVKRVVSF